MDISQTAQTVGVCPLTAGITDQNGICLLISFSKMLINAGENCAVTLIRLRGGIAIAIERHGFIVEEDLLRRWTEGSYLLKNNDTYYIMYSANYFGGKNYAVGSTTIWVRL